MRRTMTFLLAAGIAAASGCTDRSPTSPMTASATSQEEAAAPALAPVARPRNTTVIGPRGDATLPPGVWGSAEASLAVGPNSATLQILSLNLPSGGCYGRYGDISLHVPASRFSLPGTFTQLTGVYPGKTQYSAQYSGFVLGDTLTLSVTVPALQQTLGPFVLVRGVTSSWTPCLYP